MPQKSILVIVTILAAAMFAKPQPPAAPGPGGRAPQPQAIQQVKPGLYMITGAGANTTVRVTSQGLIVVDGKLPGQANYDALMALIKGVSDQPIKYLIVDAPPCRSHRQQPEISGCGRASGRVRRSQDESRHLRG